ncbi:hypothetical protein LWS67_22380, partial [Bacillus atrophaeus]|uniref:hypothetical protein n=1 Tax=Bacillus atrophaeus TaxID=1452 RepID=UPI001EFB1086
LSYAYPEVLSYNGNPYPATYPPASCCGLKGHALLPGMSCLTTHDGLAYLPCPLIHWLLHGFK